jgi:threonine/homoserine/homoserine lactone efflux protein
VNAKKIATAVLPVFVAFSLVELVIKRVRLAAEEGQSLGRAYNRVTQIERWVRRISGILFLAVGTYFTLRFIFDLELQRNGHFFKLSIRLWA